MGAGQVWKRLLWKELREGWLVGLIVLVVPPLVFTAGSYGDYRYWVNPLGVAAVQLVIVLYAARKGNAKRAGSEFAQTHLPLGPLAEWTVSLAIPTLVFAILGLAYGFCADHAAGGFDPAVWLGGVLDLSVTYVLCFFISQAVSSWAGIAVGIAHLLGGNDLSLDTLSPMTDPMTVGFIVRSLLGAAAGSIVFSVLARKASSAFRQGMALLVMTAVVVGPPLVTLGPSRREIASWLREMSSAEAKHTVDVGECQTSDRAIVVREAYIPDARNARVALFDRRTNTKLDRDFRRDVTIFGVLPDERVILGQQLPGSPEVRILEWNAASGRVRTAAVIHARQNALAGASEAFSSGGIVDPTGRWVLKELSGLYARQNLWDVDLWAVDLRTGRSAVIQPHFLRPQSDDVGWQGDRAYLAGGDYILKVDLRRMTARELRFPGKSRR